MLQTNASETSDMMFVEYSKRQVSEVGDYGHMSAATLPRIIPEN